MKAGQAATLLALAAIMLVPPAAFGRDAKVHLDPDDAAAREYAVPLDKARRAGAGLRRDGSEPVAAPLFGAGIEPAVESGKDGEAASPGSEGAGASDAGGSKRPGTNDPARSAGGVAGRGGGRRMASYATIAEQAGGSVDPPLLMAAVALATLALGAGLAIVLRRGRASRPRG